MAQLRIREENFRDNRKQLILLRQVMVNREKSNIVFDNSTENYSVFNIKYFNTRTEVINHFNFISDVQISGKFGKLATEMEYRKLFESNRQINLRLFAGVFLYNKSRSDYFSFALDRPTDYLFDYNFYGRSESTGFFSQQYIQAEGGFKSKLNIPYANQWMATLNGSVNVWNWIELYGDIGLMKNKLTNNHGIASNQASGIASSLIPGVLSNLINRTNDPNDNGFNINSIIGSLTGGGAAQSGGAGGFDLQGIMSKFTGGGLDTDGDGQVEISDIISKVTGGAQQQQQSGGGGLMDMIKGFIK